MNPDIKAINEKIIKESEFIDKIVSEVGKIIVGQTYMIERLLIGLLSNGHILLEGVPGLAKHFQQPLNQNSKEFNLHPIFYRQIYWAP